MRVFFFFKKGDNQRTRTQTLPAHPVGYLRHTTPRGAFRVPPNALAYHRTDRTATPPETLADFRGPAKHPSLSTNRSDDFVARNLGRLLGLSQTPDPLRLSYFSDAVRPDWSFPFCPVTQPRCGHCFFRCPDCPQLKQILALALLVRRSAGSPIPLHCVRPVASPNGGGPGVRFPISANLRYRLLIPQRNACISKSKSVSLARH